MTAEEQRVSDADRMTALLERVALARDQNAFRTLFEHFAPRVKAFVRRGTVDGPAAEEVVQETMVNVWRRAAQFDPSKAAPSTWIFAIARNARIDLMRKAARPEPEMDDPALVPDPPVAPDTRISRAQTADLVGRAIAGLPAEQREVLGLVFYGEKSHAAAAAALGIPLGTVKSRVRLALERIRSEIGGKS